MGCMGICDVWNAFDVPKKTPKQAMLHTANRLLQFWLLQVGTLILKAASD